VLPVWRLALLLFGYALEDHAGLFDPEPSKPGILFKQRQNAFGIFVVLVIFIAPNQRLIAPPAIARSHRWSPNVEHPRYRQRELIPSQMLDQIWTVNVVSLVHPRGVHLAGCTSLER
jgi:hypothetical protein